MNIEHRKFLQKMLAEIELFVGDDAHPKSLVHSSFVKSTQRQLEAIETRILEDEIETEAHVFQLLNLRGQRTVLKANLTLFEDTIVTLKDQIEALLAQENETQSKENKQ